MNTTSDIIRALDDIKQRLEQISTANGYNSNPSIKRGWLEMLFRGRNRNEVPLPVIAYRPSLSNPESAVPGNSNMKDVVTVLLDCAVSTKDSDTPVDDLLNLLKDVRRSLVFDPDDRKLVISDMTIQDCPFDLPESGDDYAFFSQKISFKVVEQYA